MASAQACENRQYRWALPKMSFFWVRGETSRISCAAQTLLFWLPIKRVFPMRSSKAWRPDYRPSPLTLAAIRKPLSTVKPA